MASSFLPRQRRQARSVLSISFAGLPASRDESDVARVTLKVPLFAGVFGAVVANDLKTNLRQFDHVMMTYMRERHVPGASIAISRNGEFLIRKGKEYNLNYNPTFEWFRRVKPRDNQLASAVILAHFYVLYFMYLY